MSVRLLTIKINQWARENFAVIVKLKTLADDSEVNYQHPIEWEPEPGLRKDSNFYHVETGNIVFSLISDNSYFLKGAGIDSEKQSESHQWFF